MIKNKQGTVTIIAKYSQMGHQGSKKVSGRNAHENKDNTTMCQPRAGETAVSSTHPGQEMAGDARAAQPMAEEDPHRVTQKFKIHPIPEQTPDLDQKVVEDSHFGCSPGRNSLDSLE